MDKMNLPKKYIVTKRKTHKFIDNSISLICLCLLLSTYILYPFYKLYKFNTNNKSGK